MSSPKQIIYYFLGFICFICGEESYAQNTLRLSNLRRHSLCFQETNILDSFPIIPGSIKIYKAHLQLPLIDFEIDYSNSRISTKKHIGDTLFITYRILSIPRIISTRALIESSQNSKSTSIYDPNYAGKYSLLREDDILRDDISFSGSFVRGITVGSNQSSAVNSGFNLNLSGKLANGLEISANMTDANIPIQPEGNSASIQEFDRIFIQFKKDSHKAIIGDFDIREVIHSYFLRMDRKLQGLNYISSFQFDSTRKLHIGATAGVTRGLFARNVMTAVENNQGPYKLFGNGGEAFIIIIAGTERVFVNGELMKRGEDFDYVINYNMGEITFTPKRLITNDLRIVVEFQYSDRNYFRYTLEANAAIKTRKALFYGQIFTENDNKNTRLNGSLSQAQLSRLSLIGNQIDSAYTSSETVSSWDAARILYVKKDTTIGGRTYKDIYVWAEQNLPQTYQVLYTLVGSGRGDYRLKSTGANGAVYEWVSPINGIPQGAYTPEVLISTPKTQMQSILGSKISWDRNNHSNLELSYTNHDLNTFSEKDDDKNHGIGLIFGHQLFKQIDSNKKLSITLNQEYTSDNFSPTTRYRNNEFQRDWSMNLPIRNIKEQSLTQIKAEYDSRRIHTKLSSAYLLIPNQYFGTQSEFDIKGRIGKIGYQTNHRYLQSDLIDSNIFFYRPKFSIDYRISESNNSKIELGLYHEIRKSRHGHLDLLPHSFFWQNYFLNFKQEISKKHQVEFKYIYRTEAYSDSFQFKEPEIRAHTFGLTGTSNFSANQNLKYTLNYRRFYTNRTTLNELLHNYLGRIEHQGYFLNGFFRTNTQYEVKAGREQRQQLTYIKAPNGFGNYAWQDLNGNGLFELNEAYISPINTENTFTRFFVVLPEFIPANEVSYTQFLSLMPKASWHKSEGIKNIISKFQYQMRIDLAKKIRIQNENNFGDYISPASKFIDSNLVFSRTNMFHQISFQKNESKIGFDMEWLYSNAKNLLSNGVEGNLQNQWSLRNRTELSFHLSYLGRLSTGYKSSNSEFFNDRNFSFIDNQMEHTLSSIVNQNIKVNLNAIYGFRSTGNQWNIQQQADLEFKFSRQSEGIIETKFSLVNLSYEANILNQQIELAMLNGIPKGVNYIWSLTVGQKITKLFQLNILYNGRKNENVSNILHSGNVEVRAIF